MWYSYTVTRNQFSAIVEYHLRTCYRYRSICLVLPMTTSDSETLSWEYRYLVCGSRTWSIPVGLTGQWILSPSYRPPPPLPNPPSDPEVLKCSHLEMFRLTSPLFCVQSLAMEYGNISILNLLHRKHICYGYVLDYTMDNGQQSTVETDEMRDTFNIIY